MKIKLKTTRTSLYKDTKEFQSNADERTKRSQLKLAAAIELFVEMLEK